MWVIADMVITDMVNLRPPLPARAERWRWRIRGEGCADRPHPPSPVACGSLPDAVATQVAEKLLSPTLVALKKGRSFRVTESDRVGRDLHLIYA